MGELILLAIIQGITEFIPVSSSGHLNFLAHFLPLEIDNLLLYFLVLHAGTACAAIVFFKNDIFLILQGLWDAIHKKHTQNSVISIHWIQLIIAVSIPTVFIGLIFNDILAMLGENLLFLGVAWIVTAIILVITKYKSSNQFSLENFGWKRSVLVGFAQSFALIPGISRSGSTIATALLLGGKSEFSGKLSFLASFVVIFGALLLESISYFQQEIPAMAISHLIIGFITAFIVGLSALKLLMNLLSHGKLHFFALYCMLLGCTSIILYFIVG